VLTESVGIIDTTHLRDADESEDYPGNRDHGTGHPGLPKSTPGEAGYCSWGDSDHPVTPEG